VNSERTIKGEGLFLVAIALASSEKVSCLAGEEGPHGREETSVLNQIRGDEAHSIFLNLLEKESKIWEPIWKPI
jgi:hypothetical protein